MNKDKSLRKLHDGVYLAPPPSDDGLAKFLSIVQRNNVKGLAFNPQPPTGIGGVWVLSNRTILTCLFYNF